MNNSNDFVKGYKRIAKPMCMITVLGIAFLAMIPGVSAGCVVGPGQTPIEGALVKLVLYPTYSNLTDASGCYILQNVPNGTYEISASKAGYATNVSTVFVPPTQGVEVTKDFILAIGYNSIASGQIYSGQWRTDFRVGNLGNQAGRVDINFLNTSGIVKNTSSDVISNMTTIDYIWSDRVTIPHGDADGSATIISEQPIDVFTMQRSNTAGKLGFFEGAALNTGGTQWFVSGMTYAGQWRTGFKVLNLGDSAATVNMKFYNAAGTQVNNIDVSIPAKASPYYDWYNYGYLPSGSSATEGTAIVTSNTGQALNIIASQASEQGGKLGFWNGIYQNDLKTEVFATGLVYAGQWRSGFKVANLGGSAATVNMKFYNAAGTQVNNIDVSIPAKASPYYDWYTYGYLPSGSTATDGTVKIVSTNSMPLYVVESQASETAGILDFYPAAEINGNTTAGLIYLKFEGGERSGFKIANPSETSPVSATMKFYNAAGTLVNTVPISSIAAKASPYYAWNTYTSEPSGTVTVEATGRISVVASIASETEGKLGMFKGIKQ